MTQGKRARISPVEVLEVALIAPQVPILSSPPIASVSASVLVVEILREENARMGEMAPSSGMALTRVYVSGEAPSAEAAKAELFQGGEGQHENPQAENECGIDNLTEWSWELTVFGLVRPNLGVLTPQPPLQGEIACPPVLEETLLEDVAPPSEPVCENEGFYAAAQVSQEAEPETTIPNPVPKPPVRPMEGDGLSASQSKSSCSDFISKARAKIVLEKWLALSLEERVIEEQKVRVFGALGSLCRSYPYFAASFEGAKEDLEALVDKIKKKGSSS
ncbi:unnamed protein product [Prunus armeniaca]|uniref:Uncharacterized protein n=1 Tax=Prunus armeniaca TaxID=36596 RepID=A0A6J5W3I6_PRUAR|nr:unnamed protein product [Prunus armeniaca]